MENLGIIDECITGIVAGVTRFVLGVILKGSDTDKKPEKSDAEEKSKKPKRNKKRMKKK